MFSQKEKNAVLTLIQNECERDGYCEERRIVKLVTLINISPENFEAIKSNLLMWKKINFDGRKIFINEI